MKINFKFLIYAPILFLFLPSFSFYIPGLKVFEYYFISLYIALFVMIFSDHKYIFKRIQYLTTKTPLVYYIFFLLVILINSIILSIFGVASIIKVLNGFLFKVILGVLPSIFYFICLIDKYMSLEKFISTFLKLFWISLLLGFIAYAGRWLNINIINGIFDFFANSRHVASTISSYNPDAALYFEHGKRLTGLHAEPGYLGQFLYIFLPFVYSFARSNLKLFKNKFLNFFAQNTIVLFTWANIILTMSPITLLLSFFITILFYIDSIKKFIYKYYPLFCLFIIIGFLCLKLDLSETYLIRILKVIQCFKSYELFVIVEPSLATRISSFINEFHIFLQHPFMGVGFDNMDNYIYKQLLNSPVPLTPEIIARNIDSISRGKCGFANHGFIFTLLAENGIFVVSTLLYAYLKNFASILNSRINNEFYYLLTKSLKYSLICIFILFIYDLFLVNKFYNLILALSFLAIYEVKKYRKETNKYRQTAEETLNE